MNEKEIQNIKNEIWNKYYVELQNHCSKCPYYHVQSFERMKDARRTTHRCKKLSTDFRDEYSRGYYQIMDLGTICPISNKQITSKTISEVMKLANSRAYIEIYKENNIELLAKVEDAMLLELRMSDTYRQYLNGNAYIPIQDVERYRKIYNKIIGK